MNWGNLYEWFIGLGEPYGVDPIVFGLIYVGAIPFFWAAIMWMAYNIRKKRPVTAPLLMACCCAVSAYVYLIFAGENVPLWAYGLVILIIIYAIYSTIKKVHRKRIEITNEKTI